MAKAVFDKVLDETLGLRERFEKGLLSRAPEISLILHNGVTLRGRPKKVIEGGVEGGTLLLDDPRSESQTYVLITFIEALITHDFAIKEGGASSQTANLAIANRIDFVRAVESLQKQFQEKQGSSIQFEVGVETMTGFSAELWTQAYLWVMETYLVLTTVNEDPLGKEALKVVKKVRFLAGSAFAVAAQDGGIVLTMPSPPGLPALSHDIKSRIEAVI